MTGETEMASPEVIALEDTADSPRYLPPPPLFASRAIIQIPSGVKVEVQNVTHKEVCTIISDLKRTWENISN